MLRTAKRVIAKVGLLRCQNYRTIAGHFAAKRGLEIGGPSVAFSEKGIFPLYPIVKSLDNCNFSAVTTWSSITDGPNFRYRPDTEPGYQYIRDATSLDGIGEATYDFVAASHVLEHIANPLKALQAWRRVLRPHGFMLIILPWKRYTFDHRRPFTEFSHLEEDYRKGVGEDDLSHLDEILSLHDLSRDPMGGTAEQFRERSLRNFDNRCLHHHVFSLMMMAPLFEFIDMQLVHSSIEVPIHLVAVGRALS
jgi:SAM-dependent methyltransferase